MRKRTFTTAALLCVLSVSVFSQSSSINDISFKTVELVSPWIIKGGKTVGSDPKLRKRTCLNLVVLAQTNCDDGESLRFGNRIGEHWDVFALEAKQSRMIDLGKRKWTDDFNVPEIEPWPKLRPGERRTLIFNTSGADGGSGADGADGMPGRNADGTYPNTIPVSRVARPKRVPKEELANAPLSRQVTSTVTMRGRSARPDIYNPMTEVKLGHMYLVRVVDPSNDHYLLIRVEELVRGERVLISYFKFRLEIL